MKNTKKGAWQSKRGPTPAMPAYKPPRQTRTSRKAETMSAPEIVVVESEDKSDSEEDTCFGLVYEKMADAIETPRENPYPKGIPMMSEREADECAKFGEVHRWSSDSEGDTEKTTGADKETPVPIQYHGQSCKNKRNTIVLITETEPETELPDSDGEEDNIPFGQLMNKQKESVGVETEVGMKVAKQFEAGLFVGEVKAVTGKRGRCLYTILYEDGDGEDMNDKEYKQARALFLKKDDKMADIGDINTETQDTLHSGGETEGSEFALSDDDDDDAGHKKKRKRVRSPGKEKEKSKRRTIVQEGGGNKGPQKKQPNYRCGCPTTFGFQIKHYEQDCRTYDEGGSSLPHHERWKINFAGSEERIAGPSVQGRLAVCEYC
jgi:hypothetical protein